jgi:hypothetical protein
LSSQARNGAGAVLLSAWYHCGGSSGGTLMLSTNGASANVAYNGLNAYTHAASLIAVLGEDCHFPAADCADDDAKLIGATAASQRQVDQ